MFIGVYRPRIDAVRGRIVLYLYASCRAYRNNYAMISREQATPFGDIRAQLALAGRPSQECCMGLRTRRSANARCAVDRVEPTSALLCYSDDVGCRQRDLNG